MREGDIHIYIEREREKWKGVSCKRFEYRVTILGMNARQDWATVVQEAEGCGRWRGQREGR